MKHTLLFFLIQWFLVACNSPQNHRVISNETNKNLQEKTLSFKTLGLQISTQWLSGPVGNIHINNALLVIIKDGDGQPTALPQDCTLTFYATMPSMGHPMDDAGFFEELDTGIYINKNIRYNMPGEWKNELWILDQDFHTQDKVSWIDQF